jgi:phosphoglycerate dehydrogenase-like enzyme
MNILINLPSDFFTQPELAPCFDRIARHGKVRKTSHNTPDEIAADLKWAEVVFMWSWPVLDNALLDRVGKLDYAGHIDINQTGARAELARGIPVSTSKSGFSPAVAEMALGLILNALRKISDYHAAMRAGTEKWVQAFPKDIDPLERELTGRTVGIIGLGQVGGRLRELLEPFHCPIKVHDPFLPDEIAKAKKVTKVTLPELVAQSSVIVLCAAANAGTQQLLDAKLIQAMPANAVFVNVARATLVNTEALIARLTKGDLVAAIDVFDQEPLSQNHPLRQLPNALLTPHRAGGLMSSVERNLNWLIEDFENVLAARPRRYAVTTEMISRLDA